VVVVGVYTHGHRGGAENEDGREGGALYSHGVRAPAHSLASPMPSALMAKTASASGRQGESKILQMRVSPRPLRKYSLREGWHTPHTCVSGRAGHGAGRGEGPDRVVEAWAIMWPPMGFLGSALNMDCAPSTWATTWLVRTTATPNWPTTDPDPPQPHPASV
jgi:hypothetical protein